MSGSTEVVPNSWNGYANSSTVHGIKFTSEGFSRRRRLAWGVLLFTGLSVLFGFTVSTIVEYFQYKVNTIVTVGSERAAVFPAVTLCNLNALRKSKLVLASGNAKYSQILQLAKILSVMDLTGSNQNVTIPKISGKSVRDMYRFFGHDMGPFTSGGMLLNCSYRKIPCNETFFKPVLTNLGLCYTFNPGGSFGKERYGQEVLVATQPGSYFGLKLRLSVQSDDYVLMPTQEYSAGWKVFVHDQKELPLIGDYGFTLSPGTHTFVGLVKRKVINLEPPYTTECRKEPLETGHPYSLKGCRRLCQEAFVRKTCGCESPIAFTNDTKSRLCDLEESVYCVLPALDVFRKNGNDCICQDPCESVEYTPYLSYAYFPSDVYGAELARHMVNIGIANSTEDALNFLRKNIIELDIFYQQMDHIIVKQVPAKTLRDIYSELGGLLGASLGASFLTFIELADFLGTRILRKLGKRHVETIRVGPVDSQGTK